jgi:DNA-binding transcriptional LysR family regulator
MKHWTEIRTAYAVAQQGSVSAASKILGVHRATVLRHLELVEQELGAKLFLRDMQGYSLTEAGEDLLRVAQVTDEQLTQLARRSRGRDREISGEFILTSLDASVPLLLPAISLFHQAYPKVRTRLLTSEKLVRLEYGQAHVAIRTGQKPTEDNYVVSPFYSFQVALFASDAYLKRQGIPETVDQLSTHWFVNSDEVNSRLPMSTWLNEQAESTQFILRSNDRRVLEQAVTSGLGIGLFLTHEAAQIPTLKPVLPDKSWEIPSWIVTHGDLHRSEKVQAFLAILKRDEYRELVPGNLRRVGEKSDGQG